MVLPVVKLRVQFPYFLDTPCIYMFLYYIPTGTWPTGYIISKQAWHLMVEVLKKQCSYYMALGT